MALTMRAACALAALASVSALQTMSEGKVGTVSASEWKRGPSGSDVCRCLPWKEVYATHGKLCANCISEVHSRMSNNFCINEAPGTDDEQFCFVSSACKKTGPIYILANAEIAFKTCDDTDTFMNRQGPDAIMDTALADGLDFLELIRYAYPDHATLKYQQQRTKKWELQLREIGMSGRTMTVPPAEGSSVYGVMVADQFFRITQKKDVTGPSKVWQLECDVDCDGHPKIWTLPEKSDEYDVCKCLPWKDVYAAHGKLCRNCISEVHSKMSNNFCINEAPGTDDEQFCFVSSECKKTGPAYILANAEIAFKTCDDEYEDVFMNRQTPDFIKDIALADNLDLSELIRYAYPDNAVKYSADPVETSRPLLQEVMNTGRSFTLLPSDGSLAYGLVNQKKLYIMTPSLSEIEKAKFHGTEESAGLKWGVDCVLGC